MNFRIEKGEVKLIDAIVARAEHLYYSVTGDRTDRMTLVMDLIACHMNGCPLKLASLLAADDANFAHDVFGIQRHIDRTTGALRDCFMPRFAKLNDAQAVQTSDVPYRAGYSHASGCID
jgi:hypothetical protein